MLLWPAQAVAQHGGHPGGHPGGPYHGGGTHVSVGVGFGYGWGYPFYYRPYYPFYFGVGFGWYSGYWYPWGPYPYWGAYGYPPYPYAGYPYGYYGWASTRIEVKPREAQVYIDGYYAGVVDNFDGVFQRLDVPPGVHEVAIYLQGYQTYREKMMFSPGSSSHIKTVLQPQPAGAMPEAPPQPAPGTRNPYEPQGQGAYGQPPPNEYGQYGYPQQPPSGYGAEPYGPPPQGSVEGRTMPLPERRAPQHDAQASTFGTLTMRVQPADAVVVIDGEKWDSPDAGSRLIVQLPPGQHRIEVHKDGYRSYSTVLEIRPGEPQTLNISLPPGL